MTESKLTTKQCISYATGLFGQNALLMIMGFLMVYYTDAIGISATIAGTVILVGKIWDAITDPMMGLIVDRTKTRWGKFRPYMLFGPFAVTITGILCFGIPNGVSQKLAITMIYATNILFWTTFTVLDVSYWAVIPAITKTAEERNKINTFANFGIMPGAMLGAIFAVPLISTFGSGTSDASGYMPTAAIYLVIMAAGTLFAFGTIREKYSVYDETKQKGIWSNFSVIFSNKPLILLILGILFFMLGNAVKMGGMIYYTKYVLGDENVYTFMNLALMVAALVVLPFLPKILKALGKKISFIISMMIASLSSLLMFFFGFSPAMLIALSALSGIGFAIYGVSYASMLADTVEYAQWKTGKRSEGVIYSSRTFITKLSAAVGSGLLGLILGLSHYDGMAAQQTAQALTSIRLINTLIPAVLFFIAGLPMLKYGLTEAKYNEIVQELEAREK